MLFEIWWFSKEVAAQYVNFDDRSHGKHGAEGEIQNTTHKPLFYLPACALVLQKGSSIALPSCLTIRVARNTHEMRLIFIEYRPTAAERHREKRERRGDGDGRGGKLVRQT